MTLTCYSLDADETELASIEIQEVDMLSEKYWKVVVSLHNMVEASTEVYQREVQSETDTIYVGPGEKRLRDLTRYHAGLKGTTDKMLCKVRQHMLTL
jgi:hypothetical protein